jgi:hypothetical protein
VVHTLLFCFNFPAVNFGKMLVGKAPQSPQNAPGRGRLRVLSDALVKDGSRPTNYMGCEPSTLHQNSFNFLL